LIAGIILLAGFPSVARATSDVAVHASVGFSNLYRDGPSWVPVHVSISNRGASVLTGEVAARGNTEASATYTLPVSLYPGTTKDATLYIPATGTGNAVTVRYLAGHVTMGQTEVYPEAIPDGDLLIGTLTDGSPSVRWLEGARPLGTRTHIVSLSTAGLPSVPEALAGLDAVVLTNVDTSQLDGEQVAGLRGYVQDGGTLLLVGGAGWQATLGGLPHDLIPGKPTGFRTIRALPTPRFLGFTGTLTGRIGVAPLTPARGAVVLSAGGGALVVKEPSGDGLIEYLAFDPSLSPFSGWNRLHAFASALIADATPQSMRRLPLDPADRATSYLFPGSQPMSLGSELANVPAPALAVLLGLLILILAAVGLAVGGVLLVRHMRPRLAPLAIPIALVLAVGAVFQVAPAYAKSQTIVNTISFVRLDADGPSYPATVYAGLIAPFSGDYRLQYPYPSLAANISSLYPGPYWDAGTTVSEGGTADINLGHVGYWAGRVVSLRTRVSLPGQVVTSVRLTHNGNITGTVDNRTATVLREPVLIAGQAYQRLPDIPAHSSVRVSLMPSSDPQENDYVPVLTRIYGRPLLTGNGVPAVSPFGNPSNMPREQSMSDRIRDAVDTLPETNLVSVLGEVSLVAWTDATLAPFTVNGGHVQQRNLSMLVKTIGSLPPPRGHFRVRTGTLGAHVLSVRPTPAPYTCCGVTAQPVAFGPGGTATFVYSLPGHLHLSGLRLHVYGGGSDPSASGYEGLPTGSVAVYDWHAGRWAPLNVRQSTAAAPHPMRLLSPTGTILVRLKAIKTDLSILDPHHDLQLEMTGTRS
jgi:hypothetical protein